MNETVNQTLRLPSTLAAAIDALRGNQARHAWIIDALRAAVATAEPPGGDLVIGVIEMRPGEIVPECVSCNSPCQPRALLQIVKSERGVLRQAGPLCPACAETQ